LQIAAISGRANTVEELDHLSNNSMKLLSFIFSNDLAAAAFDRLDIAHEHEAGAAAIDSVVKNRQDDILLLLSKKPTKVSLARSLLKLCCYFLQV